MTNRNVYWYLIKVIIDIELAPYYYEQYLNSNDDIDLYEKWAFTHMCSIGLAVILDYNLSFFPEEIEKILSLHPSIDKIKDLKSYNDLMYKFKVGVEQILIKEIKKNNLSLNTTRLDFVIDSIDSKHIALFKIFLERASA